MSEVKEKLAEILKFFTNRLFILTLVAFVGFAFLVASLFDVQIVRGRIFEPVVRTYTRTNPINAPRGNIYDVNGRPLAMSLPVFIVTMDPSSIFEVMGEGFDLNTAFLLFMDIMQQGKEEIVVDDEFWLSATTPRTWTIENPNVRQRWLEDLGLDTGLYSSALAAYSALLYAFDIPSDLSRDDQHTLLLMRSAFWRQRFNASTVTLGVDIDRATVATLAEFGHSLPGIRIAHDYLRYYPEGRYLTNIIGYILRINDHDYAANRDLGYTNTDMFGATGIERSFEHQLRGTPGQEIFEVDNNHRRVSTTEIIPPIPGDAVFLTIDSVLQRRIYYLLENTLATVHLNRLNRNQHTFPREILASTLRANNINSLLIMDAESEDSPASYAVQNFVWLHSGIEPEEIATAAAFRRELNEFIGDNILNGRITPVMMFEVMAEQGIITFAPYELARLRTGQLSPAAFLTGLIQARYLTPQMMNIDPATASAVISCIHTGGIIAAVNYPTFDGNNFLPHRRDNAYIHRLIDDPSRPQFSRVFMEAQSPGSTFKMITALAGLSQGVITPTTLIHDGVVFRDAGYPYTRCHSSHGSINVVDAIAASCNYFFNRVAFNLGNQRTGRTQYGIATFNYYMYALGLGSPTGVQVAEGGIALASPQLRQDQGRAGPWTDGYTIHASIGQGLVAHSVVSMAKVMATLATGGTRMEMTLVDRTVAADGTINQFEPVIEYYLPIAPAHLDAIHRGMRDVTTGNRGTGRGIFAGFPMTVAVKSGTAEVTGRPSHSSYGGFAPFVDPQIAVYVIIPHSHSPYLSAPAGHAMRAILTEFFNLAPSGPTQNGIIN
ncbi:MAG: penicillin-binding transpeptidase domain-containing protein [Defluviitaleaceae bacterium]|nr:penicillin-binding transpeptidase domain-containing protein [Defluviitaleaceae bacterium]